MGPGQTVVTLVLVAGCGRLNFDAQTAAGDPDLVLAMAFDAPRGSTVVDASAYHNDGTLVNAPTFAPAVHDAGLVFDGTDQYVTIANSASLDIGGSGAAITISFWIRIDSMDPTDDVVLAKLWQDGVKGIPAYQYGVEIKDSFDDSVALYLPDTIGGLHGYETHPAVGVFAYLAFTFDGNEIDGYVDGVQTKSEVASAMLEQRGTVLQIGVDEAITQPLHGVLDDLRIYRRALTLDEIAADMATPIR